jgi:hypothetical protein
MRPSRRHNRHQGQSDTPCIEPNPKLGPSIDVGKHLVKTKICTLFLNGCCHYGPSRCLYAHHVEELRDQPQLAKTSLCSLYKRGKCILGENCRYAHNIDEMNESAKRVKCLWFSNGHCTHGSSCRFSHDIPQMTQWIDSQSTSPSTTRPPSVLSFDDVDSIASSSISLLGVMDTAVDSPSHWNTLNGYQAPQFGLEPCPNCGSIDGCICRMFEECSELLKHL